MHIECEGTQHTKKKPFDVFNRVVSSLSRLLMGPFERQHEFPTQPKGNTR